MTTRSWNNVLDDIWAKSPDKGEGGEPELLVRHTWNVLEKLAQLIRLRPFLAEDLGVPRLWHCLFWASCLHDFGKAAEGFQSRLRGGSPWPHRHEILSLAFLDWIVDGLTEEESLWVAAAIASHHRDARETKLMYSNLWVSEENLLAPRVAEIHDETIVALYRWIIEYPNLWRDQLGLGQKGIVIPALPNEQNALDAVRAKGAERIRYWFKRYTRFVEQLSRRDQRSLIVGTLALRGYVINSDHMASAHVGELPESSLTDPAALLERLGRNDNDLHEHQRTCATINGSAVLISPTGSGKTESALLWACAQKDRGQRAPRLYYVLPYQASMNAMYDRINGQSFPQQVGLEHSRSTLALYRRLLDDYSQQQAARLARWGKNLARLNYFPVRVLSPYQILKAPYRLKGYESLFSDFFNAAFVLDEVHAYEPGRLAMILGTVKYLREQFGARFFVMSATMPALVQNRLADALGDFSLVQASAVLYTSFRRHSLNVLNGDLLAEPNMVTISQDALSGQSVLVCCNTVNRAQQAYEKLAFLLRGTSLEVMLLHGRFNGEDRLSKETTVREATGLKSPKRRPIVLVATQVVEVSLDIDLNVIYTDPAPLEALIQRFGRINRGRSIASAPVCVFREPANGQVIYDDEHVQAALAVLEENKNRMIDENKVTGWLGQIYSGEIAQRWNLAYERTYSQFWDGVLTKVRAFDSDENLEQDFYQAFDGIEVLPSCLEERHRRLLEENPLEASQLLVPIRWGRFWQLRQKKLVSESGLNRVKVVEVAYTSELGLQFEG